MIWPYNTRYSCDNKAIQILLYMAFIKLQMGDKKLDIISGQNFKWFYMDFASGPYMAFYIWPMYGFWLRGNMLNTDNFTITLVKCSSP